MRAASLALTIAGLAAAASPVAAQSFDGRVGIRYDHIASGVPFTGFFDPVPDQVSTQVQATFRIEWGTPSPSAAAVLAMGALAVARRRRGG